MINTAQDNSIACTKTEKIKKRKNTTQKNDLTTQKKETICTPKIMKKGVILYNSWFLLHIGSLNKKIWVVREGGGDRDRTKFKKFKCCFVDLRKILLNNGRKTISDIKIHFLCPNSQETWQTNLQLTKRDRKTTQQCFFPQQKINLISYFFSMLA